MTVIAFGIVSLAVLFFEMAGETFTMSMLSAKSTCVWFVEYHIFNILTLVSFVLVSGTLHSF